MSKLSYLIFVIFFTQIFKFEGSSEEQEETQKDLRNLCVTRNQAMQYFKDQLKVKNENDIFKNYRKIHDKRNGFSIYIIHERYTLFQFSQNTSHLEQLLNAINQFQKVQYDDINFAKVLFCYQLDNHKQTNVVLDGVFEHTLGQVNTNGLLFQTSKDNFFQTMYKLFNSNYHMIQHGFASTDLTVQYAQNKNNQIEYVFQPLIQMYQLPADLSNEQIKCNKLAPEAQINNIKNEKSLVFENLNVWVFMELQRQKQDQLVEELKIYFENTQTQQGIDDLREYLKQTFQKIYTKNPNQSNRECDMNKLFDKVILFNAEERINYEQFLQCFKEALTNTKEKEILEI